MISKTVVVNLPADAEARPVAVLVQIEASMRVKLQSILRTGESMRKASWE